MKAILSTLCLLSVAPAGAADALDDTGQAAVRAEVAPEPSVEEVVVTAQKRIERLQEVPISISVLSGRDLDRTTSQGMLEVLSRTPGVAVYGSDRPLLSIRGVTAGSVTSSAGANPVSYYLDTIPFGLARTAIVPDIETYDLERVEVLRGPQGTLYGANAQTGVIRILTKDANPDELELKARTMVSTTEDAAENFRGDAAINVPIVDGKLALRGAFSYQNLSGWIDRPNDENSNDAEIRSGRLKLRATPIEQLSIDLSAWISRSDYGAPSHGDDDMRYPSLVPEPVTDDYDLYGLTMGYDFSAFTLTGTTSYLDYNHTDVRDNSVFSTVPNLRPIGTRLSAHTFAQEIVLTGDFESTWTWTLGGMYRDSTDRLEQNSSTGGLPFDYVQGSESYAAFGEIGRRFAGRKLGVTLGLRQYHDNAFIKENIWPAGAAQIHRTASFDSTTPRAVLTWYPSNDFTLYGSYSQGFRSGFPQNPGVARSQPAFPSLQPDELTNYEIGLKTSLLDGRLALEGAAFYIGWRDTIQSLSVPFAGTNIAAQVNSESAGGAGFELALTARPTERLELAASFGWNDLTFDADVRSAGIVLFAEGARLNGSPEYTAGLSADYDFPLGAELSGRLSASGNYVSERADRFLLGSSVQTQVGDSLLIGRVGFAVSSRDRWSATLFVDNVSNEDGAISVTALTALRSARVRPRTIGVQLEFNY